MINKKKKLEEFRKNNERFELVVIIEDYEKTGLNINQISSMLVEIMGGIDDVDPENPKGLPYYPGVTDTTVCGDILSISITVTGNRNEVYRLRDKFINLMSCCKSWKEA